MTHPPRQTVLSQIPSIQLLEREMYHDMSLSTYERFIQHLDKLAQEIPECEEAFDLACKNF